TIGARQGLEKAWCQALLARRLWAHREGQTPGGRSTHVIGRDEEQDPADRVNDVPPAHGRREQNSGDDEQILCHGHVLLSSRKTTQGLDARTGKTNARRGTSESHDVAPSKARTSRGETGRKARRSGRGRAGLV